jgi:hypothetical protein
MDIPANPENGIAGQYKPFFLPRENRMIGRRNRRPEALRISFWSMM